ncbi:MAG: M55 family metallopeptidase [Pseudomonadota bacterium]
MRVFISADIEGIAGVVSWDQTLPDRRGYAQACEWMTQEVVAACMAARDAGATDILVADSHLNRDNINLDELPADVQIVRGGPRPLGMMQGIESGDFDVAFCIGFHTGADEIGVLNHTCNGAGFQRLILNGEQVDELDLYIRVASHFGVPVGMITGDNELSASVAKRYPNIRTVSVKSAIGRISAQTITPEKARSLIQERTTEVLSNLEQLSLVDADGPFELDVEFKWHHPAETLDYLPCFTRTAASSVRFRGADILEVARAIEFLGSYKMVPYP